MNKVEIEKAINGFIVHLWTCHSKETYIFQDLDSALECVKGYLNLKD